MEAVYLCADLNSLMAEPKRSPRSGKDPPTRLIARIRSFPGYEFTFPFLSPECGIRVVNNRVVPLYKHTLHRDRPSMALIGIPYCVVPFVVFHYQVRSRIMLCKERLSGLEYWRVVSCVRESTTILK